MNNLHPYKANNIYCGECSEMMSHLPDDCIDLTVTSPPYDNLRNYNGFTFDYKPIIEQLYRITKEGGVVVWVVNDATIKGSETGTSFRQALFAMECGFRLHDTMIYEKCGSSFPSKNRYYNIFEYMFVFSKGKPKTTNLIADRKNKWLEPWGKTRSRKKDGTLVESRQKKASEYGIRFNIWRINNGHFFSTKDRNAHIHPAIFPEQLAKDHILSWSNPNDLILDPFMGSGTTAKMAIENGRQYLGFEISNEYVELANKRLNAQEVMA